MGWRELGAARTRRQAVQVLAVVAGGLLVVRAGVKEGPRPALALDDDGDDDNNSGRGRGRGRGRGGDDDNRGPGNGEDDDEAQAPPATVPPGSAEVRIVSDDAGGFVPGELTIDAGQAVTFVNTHSDEHTATGAGFDTGIIPEGGAATVTFDEPGTYFYACQIHPVMTGSILVRGPDGTVPQRAATPAATPGATPIAGGEEARVSIANLAFNPGEVTVQAGMSVTWRNDDSLPHTVTALDGLFDSGILDPGATFSHTFEESGSSDYQCQLHPQMQGNVTAEG